MGLNGLDQTVTIVFAEPVSKFGGYWGASTFYCCGQEDPTNVDVKFFDASDGLIGVATFAYSRSIPGFPGIPIHGDGRLEWHGWSSNRPVKKVIYSGDYVVIDGVFKPTSGRRTVEQLPEEVVQQFLVLLTVNDSHRVNVPVR